jgi:hypothetical protein
MYVETDLEERYVYALKWHMNLRAMELGRCKSSRKKIRNMLFSLFLQELLTQLVNRD